MPENKARMRGLGRGLGNIMSMSKGFVCGVSEICNMELWPLEQCVNGNAHTRNIFVAPWLDINKPNSIAGHSSNLRVNPWVGDPSCLRMSTSFAALGQT